MQLFVRIKASIRRVILILVTCCSFLQESTASAADRLDEDDSGLTLRDLKLLFHGEDSDILAQVGDIQATTHVNRIHFVAGFPLIYFIANICLPPPTLTDEG